ncbi:hypothetical protein SAMN05414139_08288 [Burkholderia sp. D7]|nr:hypothetical protein SAMN05414139_08288 [Burkholderia sp. D7]
MRQCCIAGSILSIRTCDAQPARLFNNGRWRQFVFNWVLSAAQVFSSGIRHPGSIGSHKRGSFASRYGVPWRRCADAPRKDTCSRIYQELVAVFVGDPMRSPATSRPGRTAHCVTIFWRCDCRGNRGRRLDWILVSHQFGERDLVFAHLGDYFSEDDFGLALSSDVQLVLKRFALREQFFKGIRLYGSHAPSARRA